MRTLVTVLLLTTFTAAVHQPGPDALVRRPLAADTIIDGVPCARSGRAPAEFHTNGRLGGCALSREHAVGRHRFTPATWLDFTAQGVLRGAWLATDTHLDGLHCRGDGYKKWSVRFHPNGALAECRVVRDTVIAGVPCMHGTFLRELRGGGRTAIHLHPDGRLRQCQVARDTVLDGRRIAKWEVVRRELP